MLVVSPALPFAAVFAPFFASLEICLWSLASARSTPFVAGRGVGIGTAITDDRTKGVTWLKQGKEVLPWNSFLRSPTSFDKRLRAFGTSLPSSCVSALKSRQFHQRTTAVQGERRKVRELSKLGLKPFADVVYQLLGPCCKSPAAKCRLFRRCFFQYPFSILQPSLVLLPAGTPSRCSALSTRFPTKYWAIYCSSRQP